MKSSKEPEFEGIVLEEIHTMNIKFGKDAFKKKEK